MKKGEFGGGCLSLFEFNRWLLLLNLIFSILIGTFILVPQYVYNKDKTQNSLEIMNILNSNDTEQCEKENRTQIFQDTILFTKCCSLNYQEYLDNKQLNSTSTDSFLDIIQGTVKMLIYFHFLFLNCFLILGIFGTIVYFLWKL